MHIEKASTSAHSSSSPPSPGSWICAHWEGFPWGSLEWKAGWGGRTLGSRPARSSGDHGGEGHEDHGEHVGDVDDGDEDRIRLPQWWNVNFYIDRQNLTTKKRRNHDKLRPNLLFGWEKRLRRRTGPNEEREWKGNGKYQRPTSNHLAFIFALTTNTTAGFIRQGTQTCLSRKQLQ